MTELGNVAAALVHRTDVAVRITMLSALVSCAPSDDGASGAERGADTAAGAAASRRASLATSDSLVMSDLLHPDHPRAAVGDPGWGHVRESRIDLNGDGGPERLVVLARVALRNGEPLWDDAQSWNVYIESGDGRRTYLLARDVQLGTVEALVAPADAEGSRPVAVIVRSPTSLAIYEARYRSPGDATVRRVAHQEIDPAASPANRGR